MDDIHSFGKWLRHRRRGLDLTQEELAHQVGCAPITIRKLEGDEMRPSKQLAEALSGPLGIPLNQRQEFVKFARADPKDALDSRFGSLFEIPVLSKTRDIHFPFGTVHLLFSDIGGSTQLAQRLGGKYIHVLEEHQRMLRDAFSKWNGHEVSTHGDSFFAVFSRATDAVSAAIEAQHALAGKKWSDGIQLQVRIGIHTGEPTLVNQDYVGVDVHRAARICAAASPGQVLLSNETRVMVERQLPPNVRLQELGKYRLKDLNEPEHLYQLVMNDLPSDFPPLKSLEIMPNNLPVQLTSFIGRERDIEEVKRLLTNTRLVTLTGAGGTGKTRLAIEIAKQIKHQYPDGVWLIDFVVLPESSLIWQAIAAIIGLREEPNRSLQQTLTDYLRSKKLLLVFDNCEHLVSACARAADALLQACPQLYILATSREALGIPGESLYYVPTLTLPSLGAASSLEDLNQSEAVRVFRDRASLVRSTFNVTRANASSVAQICRRLDGIPLAIELAAARVKALSVEEIAARLDDRFSLLSTGNRTALQRHQTLRATIDWSYNLLSEKEQTLLSRLAVFAGGWTVESATEVCLVVQVEQRDVLSLLLNLSDKSLVIIEEQEGETRYRFLETIRQYALEKLAESGEERLVRNRHLDFFIHFAEEAERNYRSEKQLFWFHVMERERDNFRAALDYVLHTNQVETSLRLVGTAFWLWFFQGPWSEGQIWTESALAQAPDLRIKAGAKVRMALGLLQFAQSNYSAARTNLEKSLSIWKELGDNWWSAFVLGFLGLTQRPLDQQKASNFFEESLRLAAETGEDWILGFALWNSGENALYLHNIADAESMLNHSLALGQALGDRMLQNEALRALGEIYEVKQEYGQAVNLYRESLAIVQELRDITNVSHLYFNVGRALQLAGDNQEAKRYFLDALRQSRQLGKKAGEVRALVGLGVIASANGEAERAVYLLTASRSLFAKLGLNFPFTQSTWLDRHYEAARGQLGEEKLAAVAARAEKLSLDQLVNYALEGEDPA
ncbi:MAG TPA: tetratricopeptide repeat protein [Anaerolineales bacterium]|nr:tetratricopeptide repeat protein [Anaerolineales bacterium]